MPTDWHQRGDFSAFPPAYRAWVWWCSVAPERRAGGALGGSALFRALARHYRRHPTSDQNLVGVPGEGDRYTAFVDLTDFQAAVHTVAKLREIHLEKELLHKILPHVDTFVDVGANYGLFSLWINFASTGIASSCGWGPHTAPNCPRTTRSRTSWPTSSRLIPSRST